MTNKSRSGLFDFLVVTVVLVVLMLGSQIITSDFSDKLRVGKGKDFERQLREQLSEFAVLNPEIESASGEFVVAGGTKLGDDVAIGDYYEFSGEGQITSSANPIFVTGSDITIGFWVYLEAETRDGDFFSITGIAQDSEDGSRDDILIGIQSGGDGSSYYRAIARGNDGGWPERSIITETGLHNFFEQSHTTKTGEWNYIAFSIEGNTLRFYRDGALIGKNIIAEKQNLNSGTIRFGSGPDNTLFGKIAKVSVYSKAYSKEKSK